jgi:probable phosphoglycerate mutase
LIRHAQTSSNVHGLLDTRVPGADLTALGRRQAEAVPEALRGHPITSITVSNMARTSQTAEPLARRLDLSPRIEAGLREIHSGEMEMASGMDAMKRYVGVIWAWARGDLDIRMPGAENGHEFFERFDGAMARIGEVGGTHPAVFSHGAAIRVWVAHRCRNVPDEFAASEEFHNTASALVERDESGRWDLRSWNPLPLGGRELQGATGPDEKDPTGTITEDDVT